MGRSIRVFLTLSLALVISGGCTDLPTGPADTADMLVRGVSLADWTADGYGTANADDAIDQIGLTGANSLTIIITAYQNSLSSSSIVIDDQRTPTRMAVSSATAKAQSVGFVGMRVAFKLHVDLYSGEWRGRIKPQDPSAWFASYTSFVLDWASLASSFDIDQLVIGTELAGTLEFQDEWLALIAEVRGIYDGELIYAASWDEAPLVPFWEALDCVGINFYAPVTKRNQTGRFEALSGWQPWLERIRRLHKQAGRDILITEIGYRSVDGSGMHPYDFERVAAVDKEEQAHLYWAALQALGDKSWVRGVYWWNWLVGASQQQELMDYTPKGKPAEEELRDAWTVQ